jgi:hypothetical protein
VGLSVTAIAYFCSAFGAFASFFVGVGADDNGAFGIGTPLEMWIFLNLYISEKGFVLAEGHLIHKFLDDIRGEHK